MWWVGAGVSARGTCTGAAVVAGIAVAACDIWGSVGVIGIDGTAWPAAENGAPDSNPLLKLWASSAGVIVGLGRAGVDGAPDNPGIAPGVGGSGATAGEVRLGAEMVGAAGECGEEVSDIGAGTFPVTGLVIGCVLELFGKPAAEVNLDERPAAVTGWGVVARLQGNGPSLCIDVPGDCESSCSCVLALLGMPVEPCDPLRSSPTRVSRSC